MRIISICLAIFLYASVSSATVNLDANSDGATDLDKGGTGGTTAAAARENLGVAVSTWTLGTTYTASVNAVVHDGDIYICTAVHVASADDEPGTGTYWANYWRIVPKPADIPTAATLAITDTNSFYTTDYLDNAMDQISGILAGLGSASTRSAEDTMTNGSNLPDGAAIIAYAAANGWGTGGSMVYPSGSGIPVVVSGTSWGTTLTYPTLMQELDDLTWVFANGITVPSITINPSETPTSEFNDSDGAGAETADKLVASISANFTTVTEDAEVSDVFMKYMNAGTLSDAFWIDGSDNQVEFQIPTTLPAGDVKVEEVEADLKTHEFVVTKSDVGSTDTGNYVRVPTGAEWQSAYSWCDASESALIYTVYYSATLGGSFSSLGAIPHNSAAATDTVDISAWTDPVAGGWIHIDVSTAGTGATTCHLALSLTGN